MKASLSRSLTTPPPAAAIPDPFDVVVEHGNDYDEGGFDYHYDDDDDLLSRFSSWCRIPSRWSQYDNPPSEQ